GWHTQGWHGHTCGAMPQWREKVAGYTRATARSHYASPSLSAFRQSPEPWSAGSYPCPGAERPGGVRGCRLAVRGGNAALDRPGHNPRHFHASMPVYGSTATSAMAGY